MSRPIKACSKALATYCFSLHGSRQGSGFKSRRVPGLALSNNCSDADSSWLGAYMMLDNGSTDCQIIAAIITLANSNVNIAIAGLTLATQAENPANMKCCLTVSCRQARTFLNASSILAFLPEAANLKLTGQGQKLILDFPFTVHRLRQGEQCSSTCTDQSELQSRQPSRKPAFTLGS